MAKLKYKFEFLLAKTILVLSRSMSAKRADKFGALLGNWFGKLFPSRKKIAYDNILNAPMINIAEEDINPLVDKIIQNIGRTFIEQARLTKTDNYSIKSIVSFEGPDCLTEVLSEGRGGIIASAHFGNWEMQGAYMTEIGIPLDAIAKVQRNPLFDELINVIREDMRVKVIPVKSSTLRDVFKSLKQNRFVAFACDQHDPSENLIMEFLGRPASVARGPAVFAIKQQCPILPILMRRESYDRHIFMTHPPIYPINSGNEEQDIIDMTRQYLSFFEKKIIDYPDQWMWTHRRWKV
jgi:KDO2-lipid IV(A) lauroyltransferase